jgi:hypothetical protein
MQALLMGPQPQGLGAPRWQLWSKTLLLKPPLTSLLLLLTRTLARLVSVALVNLAMAPLYPGYASMRDCWAIGGMLRACLQEYAVVGA